jgi:iron(III) transport system substrate-binding protein
MTLDRRRFCGLLAAATLVRPAAAQTSPEWDAIIAAAKKEGKVVVYTATVGEPYHNKLGEAFQKKYGVAAEFLEARASEVRERMRVEQTSGRLIADLSFNGSTTTKLQLDDGTWQQHGPLPNRARLLPGFEADGYRIPIRIMTSGLLINTRLVKPQDEPKSWHDLLDPKWKGKILSDDMRALGNGAVLYFATREAFGRQFHEKLATQDIVFGRDTPNAQRRVGRGEGAIFMPMVLPQFALLKGLPVKLILPVEGCPYVRFDLAMAKGAPHPNAARLLMDFYLSEEGQLVYAQAGYGVTTKGVAEKVAPEVRPLVEAKQLGTTDPARQNAMLAEAAEIYAKG